MMHSVARTTAVFAVAWFFSACGGQTSNSSGSETTPPAQDTAKVVTPLGSDNGGDSATDESKASSDVTSKSEKPQTTMSADSCGGKKCEEGQSCIEYYGFAGRPLYTCGIPCKEGEPNGGCPDAMQCTVIPDGPTQCVNR